MLRNLFEFNVSRPFPFGRLWNLLTLIFSFLVLAFLFVYATATAGYETVTISSPDYNLRQEGWHTIFTPKRSGLCDKRLLSVGDKVYTTDGAMFWTVLTWKDIATGKNLWAVDYAGEKITKCSLNNMLLEPNMQTEISTVMVQMDCDVGAHTVSLGVDYRIPFNVYIAGTLFATIGFTKDKEKSVNWNALFDMTMVWDGISGLYAAAQNQPNYRLSLSASVNGTDLCGHDIENDDLTKCRLTLGGETGTYTRWSALDSEFNGNRYGQAIPDSLAPTFTNAAAWLIQLVYWDLGLASSTNLIRNYADRSKYIKRCPSCLNANALLDRAEGGIWLEDDVLPLTDPGFTPPNNQAFNVQYLCRVKRIKQPANFVQSVLVAVLSLFSAYWAFYKLVWVMWGTHFGEERHKRVFNGEPETPTQSSTVLPYGSSSGKPASPTPGGYGAPVTNYGQPGYFNQQQNP